MPAVEKETYSVDKFIEDICIKAGARVDVQVAEIGIPVFTVSSRPPCDRRGLLNLRSIAVRCRIVWRGAITRSQCNRRNGEAQQSLHVFLPRGMFACPHGLEVCDDNGKLSSLTPGKDQMGLISVIL